MGWVLRRRILVVLGEVEVGLGEAWLGKWVGVTLVRF